MKSVCIVGAGPAGLVGAKTLLDANEFQVTIFEKASRIGGIWALDELSTEGFLNPETPTNLSCFTVGFADLNWNAVDLRRHTDQGGIAPRHEFADKPRHHTPLFPHAWQVNRYLEAYREKYIPAGVLQFGCEVVSAEQVDGVSSGEDQRWKVVTKENGSREQKTHVFDYLMLASGFFARPRPLEVSIPGFVKDLHPDIPIIHSSQYRELSNLFPHNNTSKGRTILVIGGANSSGEGAAAIAEHISDSLFSPTTSHEQVHTQTRIVHVVSRPLYALPPFHPYDDTSTTFVPLDFGFYDLSKRLPGPIVGNAGQAPKAVKNMIHSAIQAKIGSDQSDLGSAALAIPPDEPRSTVYVALSETYPEFVRSGLIDAIPGRVIALERSSDPTSSGMRAHVRSSPPDLANNPNGLRPDPQLSTIIDDIGAVVYATGYTPSAAIEFLSPNVLRALHYDPNNLRLPLILSSWQTACPEIPSLAVLGFYEGPYWPMVEMQARLTTQRWLARSQSTTTTSSSSSSSSAVAFPLPEIPYESVPILQSLRAAMRNRAIDVPQYWFGDYLGYMEEIAAHLGLKRNNGPFATDRMGCTSPARYLTPSSNTDHADATIRDLHRVWHACVDEGRYVARAVWRALHGRWIARSTSPSGANSAHNGTMAGFWPRKFTGSTSGPDSDDALEYIYIEHEPTLESAKGTEQQHHQHQQEEQVQSCPSSPPSYTPTPNPSQNRVFRYSSLHDQISIWSVRETHPLIADHHLYTLRFEKPQRPPIPSDGEKGIIIAHAEQRISHTHNPPREQDTALKFTFQMRGIGLLRWTLDGEMVAGGGVGGPRQSRSFVRPVKPLPRN